MSITFTSYRGCKPFFSYQYRGDETNIERVKQLSTLSMTINEFAPPFNFKKSCDYTNILFRARTKSDLECELDTLDQNKKCKDVAVSDLRVAIANYNGTDEINLSKARNFINNKSSTSNSNLRFETTYKASDLNLSNAEISQQDFIIAIKKGDEGRSFKYAKLIHTPQPPSNKNLIVNGNFKDRLNNWKLIIAQRAEASEAILNEKLEILIENPGEKEWDIKLTQENIKGIKQATNYSISFEAQSDCMEKSRPL